MASYLVDSILYELDLMKNGKAMRNEENILELAAKSIQYDILIPLLRRFAPRALNPRDNEIHLYLGLPYVKQYCQKEFQNLKGLSSLFKIYVKASDEQKNQILQTITIKAFNEHSKETELSTNIFKPKPIKTQAAPPKKIPEMKLKQHSTMMGIENFIQSNQQQHNGVDSYLKLTDEYQDQIIKDGKLKGAQLPLLYQNIKKLYFNYEHLSEEHLIVDEMHKYIIKYQSHIVMEEKDRILQQSQFKCLEKFLKRYCRKLYETYAKFPRNKTPIKPQVIDVTSEEEGKKLLELPQNQDEQKKKKKKTLSTVSTKNKIISSNKLIEQDQAKGQEQHQKNIFPDKNTLTSQQNNQNSIEQQIFDDKQIPALVHQQPSLEETLIRTQNRQKQQEKLKETVLKIINENRNVACPIIQNNESTEKIQPQKINLNHGIQSKTAVINIHDTPTPQQIQINQPIQIQDQALEDNHIGEMQKIKQNLDQKSLIIGYQKTLPSINQESDQNDQKQISQLDQFFQNHVQQKKNKTKINQKTFLSNNSKDRNMTQNNEFQKQSDFIDNPLDINILSNNLAQNQTNFQSQQKDKSPSKQLSQQNEDSLSISNSSSSIIFSRKNSAQQEITPHQPLESQAFSFNNEKDFNNNGNKETDLNEDRYSDIFDNPQKDTQLPPPQRENLFGSINFTNDSRNSLAPNHVLPDLNSSDLLNKLNQNAHQQSPPLYQQQSESGEVTVDEQKTQIEKEKKNRNFYEMANQNIPKIFQPKQPPSTQPAKYLQSKEEMIKKLDSIHIHNVDLANYEKIPQSYIHNQKFIEDCIALANLCQYANDKLKYVVQLDETHFDNGSKQYYSEVFIYDQKKQTFQNTKPIMEFTSSNQDEIKAKTYIYVIKKYLELSYTNQVTPTRIQRICHFVKNKILSKKKDDLKKTSKNKDDKEKSKSLKKNKSHQKEKEKTIERIKNFSRSKSREKTHQKSRSLSKEKNSELEYAEIKINKKQKNIPKIDKTQQKLPFYMSGKSTNQVNKPQTQNNHRNKHDNQNQPSLQQIFSKIQLNNPTSQNERPFQIIQQQIPSTSTAPTQENRQEPWIPQNYFTWMEQTFAIFQKFCVIQFK